MTHGKRKHIEAQRYHTEGIEWLKLMAVAFAFILLNIFA